MGKSKTFLFAIIFLATFPCIISAYSFSPEVKLNTNDSSEGNCVYPQISSDNQGHVYTCWMDNRTIPSHYNIYFRAGEIQGNGNVVWNLQETKIGGGNCDEPRIACDDAGNVYVAWIVRGNLNDGIFFNTSDDGGITWRYSTGRRLNDSGGTGVQRFSVSIACDQNGHVYVVWGDIRTGKFLIYADYSHDYGETWHPDNFLGLFNSGYEAYFPEVSCDEEGNVYAVFYEGSSYSGYRVQFNRSSNYGVSWNQFNTRIGSISAEKYSLPHITNDGNGRVYVAWEDLRDVDPKVFFNYSHDHGITWQSEDIRLSDPAGETHAFPNMSLKCERGENASHVYAVWIDTRDGYFNVFYDYSADSGITWHQDTRVNTGPTGSAGMVVDMDADDSGHVYVTWHETRGTVYSTLWMNFSKNHGVDWLSDDVRVDQGNKSCRYPMVRAIRKGKTPYAGFVWSFAFDTTHFDAYSSSMRVVDNVISVAPGPGENNKPYVRMFDGEGNRFEEDFLAYNISGYGAQISGGDVKEGPDEVILTGPGPGTGYGPNVRGYSLEGHLAPGLNFLAYGIRQYGVNVGRGQIDGDEEGEILTGPGPGEMFGPHVRLWDYDGQKVTPIGGGFFAYGVRKYGVKVSSGDIDGDGVDEIITAPGPGPMFGAHVACWKYESGAVYKFADFMAYRTGKYGVQIGSGDVDGEGKDEILTGPGPSPAYGSHVRGWRYEDGIIEDIPGINFIAYGAKGFGCKVSGGNLDMDTKDEFVTMPGPGPSFPAHLRGFNFDDGQVVPIAALNFFAFAASEYKYGGNIAIIEMANYRQ